MALKLTGALASRLAAIPTVTKPYPVPGAGSGVTTSYDVIPEFALFVDTHRDQPHIGTFHKDIHRGFSRPTKVDLMQTISNVHLIEPVSGEMLELHPKHNFITEEWFQSFVMDYLMEHGDPPTDSEGILATSHLRDSRAKVYSLKSFRQIVMELYWKRVPGTTTAP